MSGSASTGRSQDAAPNEVDESPGGTERSADALEALEALVERRSTALAQAEALAEAELRAALAARSPATLPAGLRAGVPTTLRVPGAGRALVLHAPARVREAVVYLHGRCSDPSEATPWAGAVSAFATIIALRGDYPCAGGGHHWSFSPEVIHRRILRLLDAVSRARGGLLATDGVTLVGYSEGAHRAELLVRPFAAHYPRVLLAGPPTKPEPWLLRPARAVALMAGEHERHVHLLEGQRQLLGDGQLASYWMLPSAVHGSYGPDAARVVPAALSWLLRRAPRSPESSEDQAPQRATAGASTSGADQGV